MTRKNSYRHRSFLVLGTMSSEGWKEVCWEEIFKVTGIGFSE